MTTMRGTTMRETLRTAEGRMERLLRALTRTAEEYRAFGAGQPDPAKRKSAMTRADVARLQRAVVKVNEMAGALEAALVAAEEVAS